MHWWASIFGIVLIFIILMDAFETVVLPRRIKRTFASPSLVLQEQLAALDQHGAAYQVRRTGAKASSLTSGRCR